MIQRLVHCVKSARIWSYYGQYFLAYLSVFSPNAEKYGPEQLRIRKLFTNWLSLENRRILANHLVVTASTKLLIFGSF